MIALQQLKQILNHEFTKTHTSEDYVEGISDGIYACQFPTATALEQWIGLWNSSQDVDYIYGGEFSKEYQKGVRFVENEWNKIMSENKG